MVKKNIFLWLALFAAGLMFALLVWAFAQHGTIGLYRVNGQYRPLFWVLGILGAGLVGLALFEWRLKSRVQQKTTNILSIFVRSLTVLMLIIVFGASAFVGVFSGAYNAGAEPQLLLEDGAGANGIPNLAIVFHTAAPTSNTVKWGTDTSIFTLNETTSREHIFQLKDLQPGTKYWYQVNDGQKQFFNSAPSINSPLHFAVGSDAHFGAGDARSDLTAKMLAYIADPANGYNMLFSLGDLVEYGFKDAQWQQATQAMSLTTATIPVKYAVGNHDTLFGGLKRWETYCDPSGMTLQTGTQLWQRIDVGNVHFLVLDVEWSAESVTPTQLEWLDKQLASIPQNDWKIIVGHGFYYASGSRIEGWNWYDNPETIGKLTPLFEKYGVDLVFSGHNHQLELLQKSGVSYAICGAFGGIPDPPQQYVSPESVWHDNGIYAFMDVTINGTNAALLFRDANNKVIKSFVIPKN